MCALLLLLFDSWKLSCKKVNARLGSITSSTCLQMGNNGGCMYVGEHLLAVHQPLEVLSSGSDRYGV